MLRPPHADASYSPFEHTFTLANAPRGLVTYDDYGWGIGSARRAWYRGDRALYVSQSLTVFGRFKRIEIQEPGIQARLPAAVVSGVGLVSYAIGPELYVLDTLGLADAVTARLISTPGAIERKPGHEKPLPPVWVAALFTAEGSLLSEEDFPPQFDPLIPPTSGAAFQAQVAWARAALRCPAIRELREATEAPLGLRRFLQNAVGSLARTRFRIPPDPQEAYRRFCGPGVPPEVQELGP